MEINNNNKCCLLQNLTVERGNYWIFYFAWASDNEIMEPTASRLAFNIIKASYWWTLTILFPFIFHACIGFKSVSPVKSSRIVANTPVCLCKRFPDGNTRNIPCGWGNLFWRVASTLPVGPEHHIYWYRTPIPPRPAHALRLRWCYSNAPVVK